MYSLNGIGLRFLSFTPLDEHNCCYVTVWVTFLFFPLFPLKRLYISRERTHFTDFEYRVLSKDRLRTKEILTTYLYGYILIPLFSVGPLVIFMDKHVKEGRTNVQGSPTGTILIIAFIYSIAFMMALKYWDYKRGMPKKLN